MRLTPALGILVIPFALLALPSCKDGDTLGCESNSGCPSGHACQTGHCVQICVSDETCSRGFICEGDICVEGTRPPPEVTDILGNGTVNCSAAAHGTCFGDAITVTGNHLEQANFFLVDGPIPNVELAVADSTATTANVLLPGGLVEGEYTLEVRNASGTAALSATILQGEPGPAGPDATGNELITRINAGSTTGTLVAARLGTANELITYFNTADGSIKLKAEVLSVTGGGGSMTGAQIVTAINADGGTTPIGVAHLPAGDALLAHINSTATGTPQLLGSLVAGGGSGAMTGNAIIAELNAGGTSGVITEDRLPLGKHHQRLTAANVSTGVAVDDSSLMALCADDDGCTISLGAKRWRRNFGGSPEVAPAASFGPACRFHVDATTRDWSVSEDCWRGYDLGGPIYYPYTSDAQGRDAVDSSDRFFVLNLYGVCVLSEYGGSGAGLSPDNTAGFFMWLNDADSWSVITGQASTGFGADANRSAWAGDSQRTCELVIQD